MKINVFFMLLVFTFAAHAQKFKRFDNIKCAVTHKCTVKRSFHDLNGTASTFKSDDIGLSEPKFVGDKPLEVSILKVIDADKNEMMVLLFSGKEKDCADKTSYVSLLLNSGDRITLPCIANSHDCHANSIMAGVNEADINLLSTQKIIRARLQYVNKVEDFDVDIIGQKSFIENFQCLNAIQKK